MEDVRGEEELMKDLFLKQLGEVGTDFQASRSKDRLTSETRQKEVDDFKHKQPQRRWRVIGEGMQAGWKFQEYGLIFIHALLPLIMLFTSLFFYILKGKFQSQKSLSA